ncbi:MAG: PD-(D/E)XK nuclease family transposase, partial [Deltaproteobacteria bacterium]
PGFINRVVYNACKAYAGQLKEGDWYTSLTDVVALSICDFELWPDAQQSRQNLPPVPMLSRWNLTEQASKNHGLLQVQYAFLELPKLPNRRPEAAGPELWAWLFAHATELTEMPADLAEGPYRDALELANQARFSQDELQAYERVRDEIRQVFEIAAARWAEGKAEGERLGKALGKAEGERLGKAEGERLGRIAAIFAVLAARGVVVSAPGRASIEGCTDAATLDRWIARAASAASVDEVVAEAGDR